MTKSSPSKVLRASFEALQFFRETLDPEREDEVHSIRRIAGFVSRVAEDCDLAGLKRAANDLGRVRNAEVPRLLDRLLKSLLREVSEPNDEMQRILIVESDSATAKIVQASLSSPRREISLATDAAAAKELLNERSFSLIVLDQSLTDADGRDLLLDLRVEPQTRTIPVLMLSDGTTARSAVECLALGVDHQFQTPPDPHLLAVAVSTELRKVHERGRDALRDPITGLPNRASFCDEFERATLLSQRGGQPLTLALIEVGRVDGWKCKVDRSVVERWMLHGASVIATTLRRSDVIARWTDQQLVALFFNALPDGATIALEKTRKRVLSSPMPSSHRHCTALDLRAGVAEVVGDQEVDDVVASAERALAHTVHAEAGAIRSALDTRVPGGPAMVVQDDPITASIVGHWLQREGFEVYHYSEGAAALGAAVDLEARLVILDVKLPGMDGFELLRRLRRSRMYARVPIAMLSALDREEDIVRGLSLGADDYIVKPFSTAEFVARIRRLVSNESHRSVVRTRAAVTAS